MASPVPPTPALAVPSYAHKPLDQMTMAERMHFNKFNRANPHWGRGQAGTGVPPGAPGAPPPGAPAAAPAPMPPTPAPGAAPQVFPNMPPGGMTGRPVVLPRPGMPATPPAGPPPAGLPGGDDGFMRPRRPLDGLPAQVPPRPAGLLGGPGAGGVPHMPPITPPGAPPPSAVPPAGLPPLNRRRALAQLPPAPPSIEPPAQPPTYQ